MKAKPKPRNLNLTEKEIKILEMLSYGWTNSEIGKFYKLSIASINSALLNMLRKTNTVNRTHLVRWGFENDYLK